MPPTLHVITGSGGLHLYYRHPGRRVPCSQGRVAPGVDIRGDGGYVVAPPAVHPRTGRPYRWGTTGYPVGEMAPALALACQPPPAPPVTPRPTRTTPAAGITDPAALLAAHLDAVRRAPEGHRRTVLYGAARGVARMVLAGALTAHEAVSALTDVGREANQEPRKIRAALADGFKHEGCSL
jgi:hypothetical protein